MYVLPNALQFAMLINFSWFILSKQQRFLYRVCVKYSVII